MLLRVAVSEIRDFLGLPDDPAGAASRIRQIIGLQRWGWSGGEFQPGEWYVQVERSIYRFAHVETLDDYLEVMAKWEEEGKRPYATIPDELFGPVYSLSGEEYAAELPADTYVSQSALAVIREAAAQSSWNCDKLLRLAVCRASRQNDNPTGTPDEGAGAVAADLAASVNVASLSWVFTQRQLLTTFRFISEANAEASTSIPRRSASCTGSSAHTVRPRQ